MAAGEEKGLPLVDARRLHHRRRRQAEGNQEVRLDVVRNEPNSAASVEEEDGEGVQRWLAERRLEPAAAVEEGAVAGGGEEEGSSPAAEEEGEWQGEEVKCDVTVSMWKFWEKVPEKSWRAKCV